ncbi:MAG: carboxypeptidase regulatory-like domain-containing protein [Phycisphaerales bacterium]|nr:MAG: carboxypeptidase regulatory-like domain-containing protein [Phycisphaerales bacterium]
MYDANTHSVHSIRLALAGACAGLVLAVLVQSAPSASVSGLVRDANGPVASATVRVKATANATTTDADGRFALADLEPNKPVVLTAWAEGYYIGGGQTEYLPGASDVDIMLSAHNDQDNANYAWLSAFASAGYPGSGEDGNCEHCHADPNDAQVSLPFDEWRGDAHALSAENPRFLTMYTGTDTAGSQSSPTQYFQTRDYGRIPLRPDPNESYFGPGYKLDFPETAGNCAACHTPAAAIDAAYETDPTTVTGVGAEGAACDFCHKVWDVRLDPASGLPYPNMPGVLSFEFRRPPEGHQFFAGPLDDVAPGEDTYSPIQRQSQYCAPCHFGVFWDTVVYNSFGEWLHSPYSDPQTGRSCQDCHMPSGRTDHFARFDKGGVLRDPTTIFSHRMPGAADEQLLQNAVSMDVKAVREGERLAVTVTITNDQTGHHVPTDSPLRHLILLVAATDGRGRRLKQLDGPVVPEWGGVGDPNQGFYAGLPGKAFAKVLEEHWTELSPSGAYWNPTRVLSDNRLAAFEVDTSSCVFAQTTEGEAIVDVTLLFRRAFIKLMAQKSWQSPDIVMEHERITIGGSPVPNAGLQER